MPAYTTIQGFAAKKPFWITETGSTAAGGNQTAWIASLRTLRAAMPLLRGSSGSMSPIRRVISASATRRCGRRSRCLKGRCIV